MRKTWIIVTVFTSLLMSDCAEVEVIVRGAGRFVLPPGVPQCPSLKVPPQPQLMTTWCWAATAQMVMESHNAIESQCQIVNTVSRDRGNFTAPELAAVRAEDLVPNPRIDCCLLTATAPTTTASATTAQPLPGNQDPNVRLSRSNCSKEGWPDFVFDNPSFKVKYNFSYNLVYHPQLTTWWKEVVTQICRGRPFIFAVKWVGGAYHTAVVKGYRITSDRKLFIEVHDPLENDFFDMPYEAFMGVPRDYHHDRDWINIHR